MGFVSFNGVANIDRESANDFFLSRVSSDHKFTTRGDLIISNISISNIHSVEKALCSHGFVSRVLSGSADY